MSRWFGLASRGRFATLVVLGAAFASAGCGFSAASPVGQPAQTATPSAAAGTASQPTPTVLTEASVAAVVQAFFPPGRPNNFAGGCDSVPCPITDRLKAEIAHLRAQTPAPTRTGDLCNYDVMTGNQGGLQTPVHATVQISGDQAQAAVAQRGQTEPIVTLVVIDSVGTPMVDDIVYASNGRSIYSLNCTNSFGG